MEEHTYLAICGLIAGTIVETAAILAGQDGQLLGPFLIFCGAVVGIPVGALITKKK